MGMRLGLGEALAVRALARAAAQRRTLSGTAAAAASGLRAQGWWIPDHKPRRYPDTPERHRQAALKYGVREEDYAPMNPHGDSAKGEYPDLDPAGGRVSHALKDPFENWSYEHSRRSFGEPMPFHYLKEHMPDGKNWNGMEYMEKPSVHVPYMIAVWGATFAVLTWVAFYGDVPFVGYPWLQKQYPYDFRRSYPYREPTDFPITNFTFDPRD